MYDPSFTMTYGELSKLKQEGMTYDEYQVEFMSLSNHVHCLTQNYKINCFINGLRDVVKYKVMAKSPTTMVEAMRLVKLEEEKSTALKKNSKGNAYKGYASGVGGANSGIGASQKTNTTITVATPIYPAKS